jgi:hypothetical protein
MYKKEATLESVALSIYFSHPLKEIFHALILSIIP